MLPISHILPRACAMFPHRLAIWDGQARFTFAELGQRVNALIGAKTSLSYTGPGDFPGYVDAAEAGPDPVSVRLFSMSSDAPPTIRTNLIEDEIFPQLREGAVLYFDVRTKEMLKHVIQAVGSVGTR